MEQVSNAFKKSIKVTEREIKGYVEIIYDAKLIDNYIVTEIPETVEYSKKSEIIDSRKKAKNYASLENDRTLLDGSFILPNLSVVGDNAGFVSGSVFSDLNNKKITIESNSPVKSSGITIYFQDNIPTKFKIKINNEVEIIENENTHKTYNKIFDEAIEISKLTIEIISMEHANWRIRIPEIDLGISQVYEGEDLISFNTSEEIDLMMENTPTNICSVNLSNYENQFNPLNPKGLTRFLTENTLIKPFAGVVTENGPEYVGLGYFYIKDWSSDTNGNATINGQSIMNKLSNAEIKSDGTFFDDKLWYSYDLSQYLTNMYGYTFDLNIGYITNTEVKKYKLLDYLQTLASFMTTSEYPRKFYISRNNEIKLDSLKDEVVNSLSKTELLEDVKYQSKETLKIVLTKAINDYNMESTTKEDVLNQQYTLTATEEYVYFDLNKHINPYNNSGTFSYQASAGGRAELIDINKHLIYVKFIGQIGETITVKYNDYIFDNQPIFETTFSNGKQNGDKLELDFTDYFHLNSQSLKKTANFYLENDKKYKITGNYNGDPSILPGDCIEVETKFGIKKIIVTKSNLTFDGGLSGSFEGVGNDE